MYPIRANKLSITSYFGPRSYTYRGKKINDYHKGIDLIAKPNNRNEDILAFADGVVTSVQKTGRQYGTGCYVRLKHSNGYYTLYYHLKSGSVCVNVGDNVKKGQKLGVIGATGQATGVHLHFQIDKGSSASAINPYDYLFSGKEFISSNNSQGGSSSSSVKFKIGDEVIINGGLYTNSNAASPAGRVRNKKTKITRYVAGAKHPYNTTGDLGWMNESDITLVGNSYSKGNYKTLGNMNVRTGAGTNYAIKKVSQLTIDGKRNATSTNNNANAVYKTGTVFTALEIISNNNGTWARTPSGYVCIQGASGTKYCSKI